MATLQAGAGLSLKSILYLADFSESSQRALPIAIAVAREYRAKIHALHVLTPEPAVYPAPDSAHTLNKAREQNAEARMRQIDTQLRGMPHDTAIQQGSAVWPVLEHFLTECDTDLIVTGTHGRTAAAKLLLSSDAEDIFRRSPVPMLTIGPMMHNGVYSGAQFHRVLFATDFRPESLSAASYAVSIAQDNEAQLFLLHVIRPPERHREKIAVEFSVADAMYQLYKLVPEDIEFWHRPKAIVEHGEPGERTLEAAEQRNVDLIVLGLRQDGDHLGIGATPCLGWTTACKVVAHATCPVLTVRC
jgi:nucleotide-binding universal stress UspA family protein